jgi:hypothetical protein
LRKQATQGGGGDRCQQCGTYVTSLHIFPPALTRLFGTFRMGSGRGRVIVGAPWDEIRARFHIGG